MGVGRENVYFFLGERLQFEGHEPKERGKRKKKKSIPFPPEERSDVGESREN